MMNITNTTLLACPASELSGSQIGVAFGLVIGAGACTCVGAMVPIFLECRCCARCRHPKALDKVLAMGLGFAGGVMLYVSFVEIFTVKGISSFAECVSTPFAHLYASLSFFGGMFVAWLLMLTVQAMQRCLASHRPRRKPRIEMDTEHQMDQEVQRYLERSSSTQDLVADEEAVEAMEVTVLHHEELEALQAVVAPSDEKRSKRRLALMSTFAGIAIALHNFPEGLATFVAAAGGEGVGALLAVAIGIHNIPEGMVVAIPIYHLTGSKWKAFLWGSLSGLTEPLGALLGWAVLGSLFNGIVYGTLFSLVAGMMVYISLRELLPMAHRYDPDDKLVTWSWVVGFVVMSLSLVLFQF